MPFKGNDRDLGIAYKIIAHLPFDLRMCCQVFESTARKHDYSTTCFVTRPVVLSIISRDSYFPGMELKLIEVSAFKKRKKKKNYSNQTVWLFQVTEFCFLKLLLVLFRDNWKEHVKKEIYTQKST